MSRDEVVDKATDLIAPVIGDTHCRELVERTLGIEDISDMTALQPHLLVKSET